MDLGDIMQRLESFGTAQNRKVYARHGVGAKMFGVSFANQKALAKKIGKDQPLAEQLWTTGNHDARILATMVADPAAMSFDLIDRWSLDLDNYCMTDAVSGVASRMNLPRERVDRWRDSDNDWLGQLGWGVLVRLAMEGASLTDEEGVRLIETIEREIHSRGNRTRHAMNGFLIGIGVWNERLRARAIAAAGRIGKVEVDHGETGCKTPDAADYIRRTLEYRRSKTSPVRAKTTPKSKTVGRKAGAIGKGKPKRKGVGKKKAVGSAKPNRNTKAPPRRKKATR